MKAISFLDMVTLLTAIPDSDEDFNNKLIKLIHLYNKPINGLQNIFSNIKPIDDSAIDYTDDKDSTLHIDNGMLKLIWYGQVFIYRLPENINTLISLVNASNTTFCLRFRDEILKNIGIYSKVKNLFSFNHGLR